MDDVLTGVPDALKTVFVLLVAVVPGACLVWTLEVAHRGRRGASDTRSIRIVGHHLPANERVLLFLLGAVGYHLLLGWPEFLVWQSTFKGSNDFVTRHFLWAWAGVLSAVLIPGTVGWLLGRFWPIAVNREDPWAAGLDDLGSGWLVITTTDGEYVAGRYSGRSVAAVGERRDVYLEAQHLLNAAGEIGDSMGYGVFVPSESIRAVAFLPGQTIGTGE